ncbi:hypothetical protein BaRGS_00040084 [Batillaria attramentaria]|uniref:Uncharacterized protein n=1 Tax=Batillaria attramentaria TaxID=370345 RepID=A0ABD0J189_9CAEN
MECFHSYLLVCSRQHSAFFGDARVSRQECSVASRSPWRRKTREVKQACVDPRHLPQHPDPPAGTAQGVEI